MFIVVRGIGVGNGFLLMLPILVVDLVLTFFTEAPFALLAATRPTFDARPAARFWGVLDTRCAFGNLRTGIRDGSLHSLCRLDLALLSIVATVGLVANQFLELALASFDGTLDCILEVRLGLLDFARLRTKDTAAVGFTAEAFLDILRREWVKIVIVESSDDSETHLVVFIDLRHAALTLLLGNDFTSVLHDDLVRPEASIASYTVSTVRGLDHLNTNSILSAPVSSCCQIRERTVGAIFLASVAILLIAFIQHNSVLTTLAATIFWLTDTL
ncbi:hypothetical protein HG531_013002 [Fusarium graminearum]|nr:hypothetical protein HG531_013002 [Fusarium graminearum]